MAPLCLRNKGRQLIMADVQGCTVFFGPYTHITAPTFIVLYTVPTGMVSSSWTYCTSWHVCRVAQKAYRAMTGCIYLSLVAWFRTLVVHILADYSLKMTNCTSNYSNLSDFHLIQWAKSPSVPFGSKAWVWVSWRTISIRSFKILIRDYRVTRTAHQAQALRSTSTRTTNSNAAQYQPDQNVRNPNFYKPPSLLTGNAHTVSIGTMCLMVSRCYIARKMRK